MLAETYVRVEGAFPLIGVGGIDSGAAALGKIRAGATWCSSTARWSSAGSRWSARSRTRSPTRSIAATQTSLTDLVGADAAAMTAEPWPA